jgi:DNA polymerase-3 subunit alpha/error-prone DNA polymerase
MLPLHIHSHYSFLQSTLTVERIAEKYKELGADFVPLTDTNGMYGFIKLAKAAAVNDLKPLYGSYINDPKDKEKYLLLFAKNNDGYAELCKLISKRHLDENFSLMGIINNITDNIIVITPFIELLSSTSPKANIYSELIASKKNKINSRMLYNFSKEKGFKVVASAPVYFEQEDDYFFLKILTAIKTRSNVDNIKSSDQIDEEYYFHSPQSLNKTWKALPEAIQSISEIVNECNVDLEIGKYKYPVYQTTRDESSLSILYKIAMENLKRLYKNIDDKLMKQFDYELEVINYLSFVDYFLIVWDIVEEAKRRDIIYIGRGSAGNSLISYCLGFTTVDPIKHKMYFERFLNKNRTDPPDIDLDFSWKERDDIIRYVFEKYGYEKVAMISTHVTFRARSAFRETAKALGFSEIEIEKYSKMIPWANASALTNLREFKNYFPESQSLPFDTEPWKSVIKYASKLSGFPRHLSIHPGGIVIAPERITHHTALEYANNKGLGLIVTQPDMHGINDLGLIKIDLLSQRSLGVLRDTLKNISRNKTKPAGDI